MRDARALLGPVVSRWTSPHQTAQKLRRRGRHGALEQVPGFDELVVLQFPPAVLRFQQRFTDRAPQRPDFQHGTYVVGAGMRGPDAGVKFVDDHGDLHVVPSLPLLPRAVISVDTASRPPAAESKVPTAFDVPRLRLHSFRVFE